MLHVNKVQHAEEYKLYIELSNGLSGYFDLSPYLNKGIFTQLRDINYLKKVKKDTFGICWPKGQDLSADTIECGLQKST
jgi:hypothetical protein